jgi:serine/threonine-protein kinase SRPK3
MIELLGPIPRSVSTKGKYWKQYFSRKGELLNIDHLKFWPLESVLEEKYSFPRESAREFASFLQPLLRFRPDKRATARDCLEHPWLTSPCAPRATDHESSQRRRRRRGNEHGSSRGDNSDSGDQDDSGSD